MNRFQQIIQNIVSKIPFLQKKEEAPLFPYKNENEIDKAFAAKGLVKLTDPRTGEVSWSSPESAKKLYPEGWSGSVQGAEDFNAVKRTKPSVTPRMAPTVTPTPDRNAQPFAELINRATAQYDLPDNILYQLLRKESMGFHPDVVSGKMDSPAGARGIAQFMPATAAGIGVDPLNPDEAIPGAAQYLAHQLKTFGDLEQALAAYNAGPGNVRKYGGIPPFPETQNYVADILRRAGL